MSRHHPRVRACAFRVAALVLSSSSLALGASAAPQLTLRVDPVSRVDFAATADGTVRPAEATYTLSNAAESAFEWKASSSTAWLTVEPSSGALRPGQSSQVQVQVSSTMVQRLGPGEYEATLTFKNRRSGDIRRRVALSITSGRGGRGTGGQSPNEPPPMTREAVSQFEIKWTFDRAYEVGRFANGDWWVVGPVTIVGIDPPSIGFGGRTLNGSMINPRPENGFGQGFDSAMYGQYASRRSYVPELNVALDVSPTKPLVLGPNTSLVSTVSRTKGGARPQVQTAAILTVLEERPPKGAFRPAYCGTDKSIRFTKADLDYSRLAKLPPVPGTPALHEVTRSFERPWLDFVPGWVGRYTHPYLNMPDYGRELADKVGWASLMLNLDFPDDAKEELLVPFVQVGIDFYGILENGGRANWQAGDGHHSGRKWPILFAGIVLGSPDMAGIGLDPTLVFMGEDGQTFYVEENEPGVYNKGFGGYGPDDVGLPEWGKKHALLPRFDDARWEGDPYRVCCTANAWYGEVLSAWIMGAKELWNHDALFDYMDRYRETTARRNSPGWVVSWSEFPLKMWDTYRSRYGAQAPTNGTTTSDR